MLGENHSLPRNGGHDHQWKNYENGKAGVGYSPSMGGRSGIVAQPSTWQDGSWNGSAGGLLPNPATSEKTSGLWVSLVSFLPSSSSTSPRRLSLSHSRTPSTSYFTPSTIKFVLLCSLWYMSSAMSSNTGKAIMNQFRYPVTLTIVQFGFVAGYCLVFSNPWWGMTRIRRPTAAILRNTLPMAAFQVGGHMFSSMAISRVPVATVHTIKALSPLFTVAAYALLFGVRYSPQTYISLLPLTLGVMLACSFDLSFSNAIGLLCAFGSAIVFVTSNIFFKKIMPSPSSNSSPSLTSSHKLDKINLLFYSSGLAFLLMIPIWLWSDLARLLAHDHHAIPTLKHTPKHGVTYYFFMNGTVHFAQNIIAFTILSITSPVTYSIASLVKRIAVICIAIVWFSQTVHVVQGLGIALTFIGLWMYNAAKADVERGENKMRKVEARREMALPSTRTEARVMDLTPLGTPQDSKSEYPFSSAIRAPTHTTTGPPPHSAHAQGPPTTVGHPPYGGTHGQALPRIQTNHPQSAKSYPPGSSPTEPYPSPPASIDSPPQTAIRSFVVQSNGVSGINGNTNLFNRRPAPHDGPTLPMGDPPRRDLDEGSPVSPTKGMEPTLVMS